MTVPDWWQLVLLILAVYSTFYLVAEDKITDRPRRWILGLGDWEHGSPPASYRKGLGDFLTCPWCMGFWLWLGWWGCWQIWPHGTLVAAGAVAGRVGVAFLHSWFDSR